MKIKQTIPNCLFMIMSVLLIFSNSCKKNEDSNSPGTFTDSRDSNVYKTVTIGRQVWMAENLKYLPRVAGPDNTSATTPYYYVFNYDGTNVTEAKVTANYSTYGVLYNWKAALTACPAGWHLPSDMEWLQLINYLGGLDIAGLKLKETGTTHWNSSNTGATNITGFTALPGGSLDANDGFVDIGWCGYWWSATEYNANSAWHRSMDSFSSGVYNYNFNKMWGFSVRCIKD